MGKKEQRYTTSFTTTFNNWSPPKSHSALEMFLSQMEGENFHICLVILLHTTLLKKNGKP